MPLLLSFEAEGVFLKSEDVPIAMAVTAKFHKETETK